MYLKIQKKIVFDVSQDLKFYLNNKESFEILNRNIIKKIVQNASADFVFCFVLVFIVYLLIAANLKIEAVAGFLTGIFASWAVINLIINNIQTILNLAEKFFLKEYKNDYNKIEYDNIVSAKRFFSFFENFSAPILNSLLIFWAISSFALIPVLNSFM